MSKRQGIQPKRPLDGLFTPPVGAEDAFLSGQPRTIVEPGAAGVGIDGITGVNVVTEEGTTFYLDTPDAIYIVDQKLRRAPGGQQVVDVTIDVEDIIGAAEYEVQVAKV